MKFVATEDISAPIDRVWSRVSDIEGFEMRLRSRVDGLTRTPPGPPAEGTTWTGRADVMGKKREMKVVLGQMQAPARLEAEAATDGMAVTLDVELAELGPRLTRMTVTTEARARSLTARLMLQSAKMARQSMAKRYRTRVADFAAKVEKGAA
ncbi:SRPBCC family protein [Jannaschia rubra]|uniref:Polyketide cyclase / dehydrase and lipid transport n=1 Tax=Jannaschia rubra TaxID=282197 RepID=A0A0M6XRF0_9RHOB|nr:SRPBCC family protein [Jannaschia rubra]CTQ33716.1 Polyketide cyclase / dehydrase and lipid transport [Jannaschia rubra]SFG07268.1 Carbon monoxide dehydrogenase subunit G [Jannaschia rubra]